VAPDNDIRDFELYFERLDAAGLGSMKRPDLLLFTKVNENRVLELADACGGTPELPFIPEDNAAMQELLSKAVVAVECENSLWKAELMPQYGKKMRPMRRLGGLVGLPKNAVLPTVIIKEEDREPLKQWQRIRGVPIHIWHVFFDMAFGLSLNRAEQLITGGQIGATEQVFQAPGGATTRKSIYKIYYHYAYPLGKAREEPTLSADVLVDKNGHVLPYVAFSGGSFDIALEALKVLSDMVVGKEGSD